MFFIVIKKLHVSLSTNRKYYVGAGWSSLVARQAHNLKVVGSNPAPATKSIDKIASPLDLLKMSCSLRDDMLNSS